MQGRHRNRPKDPIRKSSSKSARRNNVEYIQEQLDELNLTNRELLLEYCYQGFDD